MGRTSSIDAAAAVRLDQALKRHPHNLSAAAREAGVGKHAAQRYVAKLREAGELKPRPRDLVAALDAEVLALQGRAAELERQAAALHRHIQSILRTLD